MNNLSRETVTAKNFQASWCPWVWGFVSQFDPRTKEGLNILSSKECFIIIIIILLHYKDFKSFSPQYQAWNIIYGGSDSITPSLGAART